MRGRSDLNTSLRIICRVHLTAPEELQRGGILGVLGRFSGELFCEMNKHYHVLAEAEPLFL